MSWICFMRFTHYDHHYSSLFPWERYIVLFRDNALYFSWTEMRSTYRVEIKGDYRFNLLLQGIHGCFIVTNGFEYDRQKKHLRQTCPSKQIQLNTTPSTADIKINMTDQSDNSPYPFTNSNPFIVWMSHIQWPI